MVLVHKTYADPETSIQVLEKTAHAVSCGIKGQRRPSFPSTFQENRKSEGPESLCYDSRMAAKKKVDLEKTRRVEQRKSTYHVGNVYCSMYWIEERRTQVLWRGHVIGNSTSRK